MRILRKGPCRDVRLKSRPGSKGKGKRKHGRRRSSTTTTTTTSTSTTAATPANRRHIYVRLANKRSRTTSSSSTTTTTSTTTMAPMQFHRYMNLGNPHVSVSRAVHAYSVYNIPDVGLNYDAITDSSLSLYVPGVGTITDTPPSTTPTSTTSTTITPKPQTITSTTAIPNISETLKTSSAPREEIKFFYVPYGTTSTTTVSSSSISVAPEVASTTATIADTIAAATVDRTASTTSTTKALKLDTPDVARNATGFKANTATSPKPEIPKPHRKPIVLKN